MGKGGLANFVFNASKFIDEAIMIFLPLVGRLVSTSKMGYYFRVIKESHEIAQVLGET